MANNNIEDLPLVEPDGASLFQSKQAAAKARREAIASGLGKDAVMAAGEAAKQGFLGGLPSVTPPPAPEPIAPPAVGPAPGQQQAQQDVFTQQSQLALDQLLASQAQAETEFATGIETEAQRLAKEQDFLAKQLETQFAPKFAKLDEDLARAEQMSGFTGAAKGSVRGSRQAREQERIADEGSRMRQAIAAEQARQLALSTAVLKGESDERIESLQASVNQAKQNTAAAKERFDLAQQGLLQGQLEAASAADLAALEQFNSALEAQGLIFDPTTGGVVTTLEGDQKKAQIAKTDAQTQEIFDKIQSPNIDVTYKTDELGNVNAIAFNEDTGEFEIVELGKLDKAQKWALGVGPSTGGVAVTQGQITDLGFDPSLGPVYEQLNEAIDANERSLIATRLEEKGLSTVNLEVQRVAYNKALEDAAAAGGELGFNDAGEFGIIVPELPATGGATAEGIGGIAQSTIENLPSTLLGTLFPSANLAKQGFDLGSFLNK